MPISSLTLAESWTKLARAATRFITPKDNKASFGDLNFEFFRFPMTLISSNCPLVK